MPYGIMPMMSQVHSQFRSPLQLKKAVSLLGEQSDLQFRLDGFTVLSSTPLSFFRDGETVLIRSPPHQQQQNQEPVRLSAAKKRKRAPEVAGKCGHNHMTRRSSLLTAVAISVPQNSTIVIAPAADD